MLLTIFTPAYNRGYCIDKLYQSLISQTDKNFEWIVVDDGSTDSTQQLIESFIEEGKIDVRYYRQDNGGKHTAINRGVANARGEFFFIVDSDDYLTPTAVEDILGYASQIADNKSFAGVSGLRIRPDGTPISRGINAPAIDATSIDIRFKHNITGDLAEVFKTSVMRKYPFPVFADERFVPEALIWNRIAADGLKLRVFNKGIYYCEYLPDGLTASITRARAKSPKASAMYYAELTRHRVPYLSKVKGAINYWRFFDKTQPDITPLQKRWIWLKPIGRLFSRLDNKSSLNATK